MKQLRLLEVVGQQWPNAIVITSRVTLMGDGCAVRARFGDEHSTWQSRLCIGTTKQVAATGTGNTFDESLAALEQSLTGNFQAMLGATDGGVIEQLASQAGKRAKRGNGKEQAADIVRDIGKLCIAVADDTEAR